MSDENKDANKDPSDRSLVSHKESAKEENASIPVEPLPTKTQTNKTKSTPSEPIFSDKAMPRMAHKKKAKSAKWLPICAILLALITIVLVSWSSYQQSLIQKDWAQMSNSVEQQLNRQSAENQRSITAAESGRLQASENQQLVLKQNQLIQQLKQSLTATQEKIRELSGRRAQDWLLAEAEYLIKLADYKVSLEKDQQTAIALLKTADEKITRMGDNSLLDIRQAIAQDIANLQLVINPDIAGIAMQLNALSEQIPNLSLTALQLTSKELGENEATESTKQTFSMQTLYNNFLKDFVIIKDHSQAITPLMTPKARGHLNANIQLALQQGQIALVRGEQELFKIHLDKAINWTTAFFSDDAARQVLIDGLTQISTQRITRDMPKALASHKAITAVNHERLYQWLEKDATNLQQTEESQP